jgi:hypothetical protein
LLIFVFAGVSYGRSGAILAEFAPVPNAPSELVPPSAPDVKSAAGHVASAVEPKPAVPEEMGGPQGPEPTRFGDWEKNGRCVDF